MNTLFYEYPPCSTCRKAKKYLVDHNIAFQAYHIVTQTPTKQELQEWIRKYNIDIKSLFNTSGNVYKELNLKDTLASLSTSEKLDLLASNGMLIKRPILLHGNQIYIGFKEALYQEIK